MAKDEKIEERKKYNTPFLRVFDYLAKEKMMNQGQFAKVDVSVTASDANSQTIASVRLEDVPMKRNTTTSYSGPLFTRQPTFTMTLDDSWGEDITDTW